MIRLWKIIDQLKLVFNYIETLILWPSDLLSKEAAHLSTWPWDTTKVLLSFWLLYYYFSSYMVPKVPHHKHFLHKSSIESNLFLQDNDNFLEFPFSYHLNINHMSLYYYQQNCKSKKSRYIQKIWSLAECRWLGPKLNVSSSLFKKFMKVLHILLWKLSKFFWIKPLKLQFFCQIALCEKLQFLYKKYLV